MTQTQLDELFLESFNWLFYGFCALALLFLIVAIVYFFRHGVWDAFNELRGKTVQRQIAQMQSGRVGSWRQVLAEAAPAPGGGASKPSQKSFSITGVFGGAYGTEAQTTIQEVQTGELEAPTGDLS